MSRLKYSLISFVLLVLGSISLIYALISGHIYSPWFFLGYAFVIISSILGQINTDSLSKPYTVIYFIVLLLSEFLLAIVSTVSSIPNPHKEYILYGLGIIVFSILFIIKNFYFKKAIKQ